MSGLGIGLNHPCEYKEGGQEEALSGHRVGLASGICLDISPANTSLPNSHLH